MIGVRPGRATEARPSGGLRRPGWKDGGTARDAVDVDDAATGDPVKCDGDMRPITGANDAGREHPRRRVRLTRDAEDDAAVDVEPQMPTSKDAVVIGEYRTPL